MALYFIASWVTKLAIQAGLPQTQAIIASAIYSGGAVVGAIVVSVIATKIDVGHVIAVMLVLATALYLIFGGVKMSVNLLLTSFLIGVTLQGGVNAIYPLVAGAYPPEARVTGLGWAMGIGRLGAFLGPLVGGWAIGHELPLVAVFGIFCIPLLITGAPAVNVRPRILERSPPRRSTLAVLRSGSHRLPICCDGGWRSPKTSWRIGDEGRARRRRSVGERSGRFSRAVGRPPRTFLGNA